MTIKNTLAAAALTLMIAAPAFAQTGASIASTTTPVAPVQAQADAAQGGDIKTGTPAAPIVSSNEKGGVKIATKAEHKDMHKVNVKDNVKQGDAVKTDDSATVKQ